MRIRFLGCGPANAQPDQYQSNLLLRATGGQQMLIDCGGDVRFALHELGIFNHTLGQAIQAIYLSHLHADHIGGMEWVAFNTYFSPHPQPHLFMEADSMDRLWEHSLKGGLGSVENKIMHLTDYFLCQPLAPHASFTWEGIHFQLVPMPHVRTGYHDHRSYGLWLEDRADSGARVFFSSDAQFAPEIITHWAECADVIFHDCETAPVPSQVHARYEELRTLPAAIKAKMWLYHYQAAPLPDARCDGFAGFVTKGQEFIYTRAE